MTLEAIRYRSGSLQILNQLLLPHETVYEEVRSVRDGYEAIKSMKVRRARRNLWPVPFSRVDAPRDRNASTSRRLLCVKLEQGFALLFAVVCYLHNVRLGVKSPLADWMFFLSCSVIMALITRVRMCWNDAAQSFNCVKCLCASGRLFVDLRTHAC